MVITRTFGPRLGAGTQVNEVAGQESIMKGALGSTVLIGVYERGLEGGLTICPSRRSFDRKCGGLLDSADIGVPTFASLHAPYCARDFWKHSKGAGILGILRVVPTRNDGTQDDRPTKSSITFFNREANPKILGVGEANNGGNWGGKRKAYLSLISGTPGTDFPTANQVQLSGLAAKTLKNDEFKNGTLILDGLPSNSYKIVNNTPLGLVTLESDQDVITDWGTGETSGNQSTGVGPFNLGTATAPYTINVTTEAGGPDTITILAVAASVGDDGVPAFDSLAASIFFVVNSVTYEAVFAGTEAAIADYIDVINAQIPGVHAEVAAGNVVVYTDQKGTGATVTIDDAASNSLMVADVFSTATPTETAGTGDVVSHFAATATEIGAQITADAAASGAVGTANASGTLTISSGTSGSSSTLQTPTGTLLTLLGLDTSVHTGTDGPSDLHVSLTRSNINERDQNKAIDVEFRNGSLRPTTEFAMIVRIDGTVVLKYENLSVKTLASNYWADVINDDPNNDVITITDSFTGDRNNPDSRPMNHYGISTVLTATRLTVADPVVYGMYSPVGSWVPAITWNSWGTDSKVQRLKVTMSDPTNFTITTNAGNRTWAGTIGGGAVDMESYVGSLTIAAGTGSPTAADYFYLYLNPLQIDECIGGSINPNVAANQKFKIIDNGIDWVDVSVLNDLTNGGVNSGGEEYMIQYPLQLENGYDGYIAGMTTADYEQLMDSETTPLNRIDGQGWGLVKVAVPGISYYTSAVSLQQKNNDLCYDKNWMAKDEFPWSMHDYDVYKETDFVAWVENTLTRNTYASIHLPSYQYVRDPLARLESEARLEIVPLIGAILGYEAKSAYERKGYHKAPAGTKAVIMDTIKLPIIGKPDSPLPLDEEILTPGGINVVKWGKGGKDVILWGDRTISASDEFKFYHKRTLLSHYENDLLEGTDFTIFEINDPIEDENVLTDFYDYFLPEWRKRAIRGDTFTGGDNPAAIFKMDEEINTDATRDAGDQNIEVSLRLADTIERLRIYIGPMGLSE